MFSDDSKHYRIIAKWVIGIVSACILIYLGIRYIHVIAASISWLIKLVLPLLLGIIFALILNLPLHFFEDWLFTKKISLKAKAKKRNISIFLSLLSILGIFILALFLVVPELVQAIITLVNIGTNSLEALSIFEESLDLSALPFGEYWSSINIDWNAIISWLQNLLPSFMTDLTEKLPKLIGSSFGIFLDVILGIIFSIYILAQKENLKKQVHRMLTAWLPEKWKKLLLHVAFVCTDSFRNFIVGQTTESIILGTLCTLGMAILSLPYAPTIGVLVGVTAFIPYVGAYIGAIVGCIMILTVNPFKAIIFLIFLVILQQVEGNIIYPKVVGSRINLPSLWVLFALTVGGGLAGPVGMLLGVPAFSTIYKLMNEATKLREEKIRLNTSNTEENEL